MVPLYAPETSSADLSAAKRESVMRHRNLIRDETAATAIEYGLIAALIAVACIMAFQALGLNLATIFTTATNAMAGA